MEIRKLKIALLFSIAGLFSIAQETLPQEEKNEVCSSFRLAFFFTYSDFDFGEVNNFLESSGMPKVQDGLRSLPVFYYTENLYRKRLFFDVSVGWRNSGTKSNNDYAVKQNIFHYDLGFRYVVLNKTDHNFSLGAFVGRTSYTINIDNILENQQSDRIQKRDRHLGVRVLYTFFDHWHFTAGYRFNIDSERVSINGHSYSNSPKLSSEGLFFGIGIGL